MAKGVVYVMTSVIPGLLKIGKTETRSFESRMRTLETNGYHNITGLRRFLAIELDNYSDKESLLHQIFSKHQVGNSELFALDRELVRRLLLSFDGRLVYPEGEKPNQTTGQPKTHTGRKPKGSLSTFYKKGLKSGDRINLVVDRSIVATIVGERKVECQGRVWSLSPLTKKILVDKGLADKSRYSVNGFTYWQYKNQKLTDIPNTGSEA